MEDCAPNQKDQFIKPLFILLNNIHPRAQSMYINTFTHSRKDATAFKYVSDGSGRDSYVLINSGGLHATTVYGQKNMFANSLRYCYKH